MRAAELRVIRGEPRHETFKLPSSDVVIGRSATADIQLCDESVSREHATILEDGGSFTLEDLQSTNGTLLNGKRIRSNELQDGDEIQIGRTVLLFVLR